MNDLVSEYQQYQDASVDEEEFDEEEEAEDAEWIVLIAEFKMPRRRRQRECQKSNRFRLAKQQQLCTCAFFFVHFFTVTAWLGREKALHMVVRNSAPEEFACI